jgi:hypothetical protein
MEEIEGVIMPVEQAAGNRRPERDRRAVIQIYPLIPTASAVGPHPGGPAWRAGMAPERSFPERTEASKNIHILGRWSRYACGMQAGCSTVFDQEWIEAAPPPLSRFPRPAGANAEQLPPF